MYHQISIFALFYKLTIIIINKKHIVCTVTNDLTYDQRMIRICTSLVRGGYKVTLIGRKKESSKPLVEQPFQQYRLSCWFQKGKFFYLEYNWRLFWYLLFKKFDLVCSIDLDSILPAYIICRLRRKSQVYDAHEYYTETPEVVRRPRIQQMWGAVANICIPNIPYCYTVGETLSEIFAQRYGVPFAVIRNVPFRYKNFQRAPISRPPIIFYQGALNEGRGLEAIIGAMQHIEGAELWLAGEGDLSQELRQMVKELELSDKVKFLGFVQPKDLKALTLQATIGLNLLENKGLSYYYSLANKAFDYIQAEIPSINMSFPEYQRINKAYNVFCLVDDLDQDTLITAIQSLLNDKAYYQKIQNNCAKAKDVFVWEREEEVLLNFYNKLLK